MNEFLKELLELVVKHDALIYSDCEISIKVGSDVYDTDGECLGDISLIDILKERSKE